MSIDAPLQPSGGLQSQVADENKNLAIVLRVRRPLPMRGATGIWESSCFASAQLGQAELTGSSGIAGRFCELRLIDASDESPDIDDEVACLIEADEIDAIVGTSIRIEMRGGEHDLGFPRALVVRRGTISWGTPAQLLAAHWRRQGPEPAEE